MTNHFNTYSKKDLLQLTHLRKFETKLGEVVEAPGQANSLEESLRKSTSKYVIIGVPEDAGVKANMGTGGTNTLWNSFLKSFLNIQSNDFLSGDKLMIAGYFDFNKEQNLIGANAPDNEERLLALRSLVNLIDHEVEEIVKAIISNGKIPIIIGGGHNNAYPAIKGSAKALYKNELIPLAQINCINLDAHSDYRPAEGRHSGNAFRYADNDGYLNKYCIIGIHENYLQQNVLGDLINNPFIDFISYEDIFIHERKDFIQAVSHAIGFTDDNYTGIELDMDSIQHVLSSARTPSGLSPLQARQFINFAGHHAKIAYVHICEGASELSNGGQDATTGKLVSYLVSDFVKANQIAH
ncbi:MAG: arginase family protein [Bacteroidetes bacterium]|nr:arginase family protein [Bacteroidota bacterium]